MLVILSGVSGAGKDTIKNELINRMLNHFLHIQPEIQDLEKSKEFNIIL